jgi:hypothetical protein
MRCPKGQARSRARHRQSPPKRRSPLPVRSKWTHDQVQEDPRDKAEEHTHRGSCARANTALGNREGDHYQ